MNWADLSMYISQEIAEFSCLGTETVIYLKFSVVLSIITLFKWLESSNRNCHQQQCKEKSCFWEECELGQNDILCVFVETSLPAKLLLGSLEKSLYFSSSYWVPTCRGPAPAGSRGTLRMNGVSETETRRTGLDRAKSARKRERRKKETRPGICSRVWQLLYFSP